MRSLLAATACSLIAAAPAAAHPHVWIDARTTLIFDEAGRLAAIGQEWTFDEFYSAFAVEGLDTNRDGIYAREEIHELAQVNVRALADFDYFIEVEAGGTRARWGQAHGVGNDYTLGRLTMRFTVVLASPIDPGAGPVDVRVFDPSYYIAIDPAPDRAVAIENAPPACAARIETPEGLASGEGRPYLDDSFMAMMMNPEAFARRFASVIRLSCGTSAS